MNVIKSKNHTTHTSAGFPQNYNTAVTVDEFKSGDLTIAVRKIDGWTYPFLELSYYSYKWVNFCAMYIEQSQGVDNPIIISLSNDILIELLRAHCSGEKIPIPIRKHIVGQDTAKLNITVPTGFKAYYDKHNITFEIINSFGTGCVDIHTWCFLPLDELKDKYCI